MKMAINITNGFILDRENIRFISITLLNCSKSINSQNIDWPWSIRKMYSCTVLLLLVTPVATEVNWMRYACNGKNEGEREINGERRLGTKTATAYLNGAICLFIKNANVKHQQDELIEIAHSIQMIYIAFRYEGTHFSSPLIGISVYLSLFCTFNAPLPSAVHLFTRCVCAPKVFRLNWE